MVKLIISRYRIWNYIDGECEVKNGHHMRHDTTFSLIEWIVFYYNHVGPKLVWENDSPIKFSPTSALIFWNIVIRVSVAKLLISWQENIERKGKKFSIKDEVTGIINKI